MADKPVRQRLDLLIRRVVDGDDPNHLYMELEFDPRRYEWLEEDGERCLYDRFEKALIPERVIHDMVRQMDHLPIYYQPPLIRNATEYVASRQNAIVERLKGPSRMMR